MFLGLMAAVVVLFFQGEARAQRPVLRKPPPPGVIELIGLNIYSVVELKDGSILANNGRVSKDGGKTWSDARPLIQTSRVASSGAVGTGLLRLKSGKIALTAANQIWVSADEGKTWDGPVEVISKAIGGPYYLGDEMIQLSSGRLLYPFYISFDGDHPEFKYENVSSFGTWRGQRIQVEGHGHMPEIYVTLISISDDEGRNWDWAKNKGGQESALMGWFDEEGKPTGHRGVTGFGEATVAETKDGRVLIFGRPLVNRVVQSYSGDGGKTWSAVLPSELTNSIAPARLKRIPKTGDLMCIWNQVSQEEVQRGFRRGRLSVAISKDSGATWENFKTLELSEGLEDVARIPPEVPIKMVRARDFVGQLPDGYLYAHYANVSFIGDKVFIVYPRGGPLLGIAEQNLHKQEQVLRIYPLEWFYKP